MGSVGKCRLALSISRFELVSSAVLSSTTAKPRFGTVSLSIHQCRGMCLWNQLLNAVCLV
jgi:hypothetical protein